MMSAYKTAIIRIGEAEYQRLRAAEEELRLQELKQGSRNSREANSLYGRILDESRLRDVQFNQQVAGLDHYLLEAAEQTESWLSEQNQKIDEQLNQIQLNSTEWMERVSQEYETRQNALQSQLSQFQQAQEAYGEEVIRRNDLEQAMAARTENQEGRLRQMEIQIINRQNSSAEKETQMAQEAERWIESGRVNIDFILDQYDLDLQTANELELVRMELNEAVRLYNLSHFMPAWQAAFASVSRLNRLRFILEADRSLKERVHHDLISHAHEVYQRILDQQGVQAMDIDGNELSERIDTSFWTDGAYAFLVEQCRHACASVEKLTNPDLTEMAEWREELDLLADRGLELVTQGRLAVLASQLRFNVAQIVVQALESQGFFLESACYKKNDYRGAFIAETRNLAGNEVIVTIDPDPGLEEGGRLSIQSTDVRQVTEHELNQRTREIYQAIELCGVNVNTKEPARVIRPRRIAEASPIDSSNQYRVNHQRRIQENKL